MTSFCSKTVPNNSTNSTIVSFASIRLNAWLDLNKKTFLSSKVLIIWRTKNVFKILTYFVNTSSRPQTALKPLLHWETRLIVISGWSVCSKKIIHFHLPTAPMLLMYRVAGWRCCRDATLVCRDATLVCRVVTLCYCCKTLFYTM